MPIHKVVFRLLGILLFCSMSEDLQARAGWDLDVSDPSTVRIQTRSGVCTGTRISQDGHILTARHCLDQCLINSEALEVEDPFPELGWSSPKRYSLKQTIRCQITIDNQDGDALVLMIGPYFMTPMAINTLASFSPELYAQYLEEETFHNGDYAILQVQDAVTPSGSCRKLSNQTTAVGSAVHFYGYPGASRNRPAGMNSDGLTLARGQGEVVPSIVENSCVLANPNRYNFAALAMRYDRSDILLSSVDVIPGASGSSLRNSRGELVALINSQFRQGVDITQTYCEGATVSVPIQKIYQRAQQVLGLSETEAAFYCENEHLD